MNNKSICEKFLEKVEEKTDVNFEIIENGNNPEKYGYVIEGEFWSDLGEDVIINLVVDKLTIEEIANAMYEYQEDFDAEEHASSWFMMNGAHGAPTSLRALLRDADEQQEKFTEISEVMTELFEEFTLNCKK